MSKRCTEVLVGAIVAIALAMPTARAQVSAPDPLTTTDIEQTVGDTQTASDSSAIPTATVPDPSQTTTTTSDSSTTTQTTTTTDPSTQTAPAPSPDPTASTTTTSTTTTATAPPPPPSSSGPGPSGSSGPGPSTSTGSDSTSTSGSGTTSTTTATSTTTTDPTTTSTAPAPSTSTTDSQTGSGDADPPPPPAADPVPDPGTAPDVPTAGLPANGPRFLIRARAAIIDDVISRHGMKAVMRVHDFGTAGAADAESVVLISGPDGMSAEAMDAEMDSDPDVLSCEFDRTLLMPELAGADIRPALQTVVDGVAGRTLTTFFGNLAPSTYVAQPATTLIHLPETQTQFTGAGIVAVIDTGVDATHPLLNGSVTLGYDFTREQEGAATDLADLEQSTAAILEQSTAAILEENQVIVLNQSTAAILEQSTAAILEGTTLPKSFGHGTMVAGLVHLAAPTAAILPLKAFNASGASTMAAVVRAVYYAVDHGARVINMSFSLADPSPELMRAINYATSHRVTCVAASGNAGTETTVFPAAYRNVIAVASTDNLDRRSLFSNWGDADVTLTAPGEAVTTTFPGGHFAAASGTSFSTALVSGSVALMLQRESTLSPREAFENLSHGAKTTPRMGYGRLDLLRALSKDGSGDGTDIHAGTAKH